MTNDDAVRTPPPPPPLPADREEGAVTRIGRYELLEKIGRGGMGVVYRGKDTVIGRLVAVKMLISDIDVSDETRERFFREARSAGQLAHRNIITIFDFGEEGGRAYIVMELLTGESLTSLLARNVKLPLEQQAEIMMRVSEGLAFAHSRGIVHRDVKPANLFITADGQHLQLQHPAVVLAVLLATWPDCCNGFAIGEKSQRTARGSFLIESRNEFSGS